MPKKPPPPPPYPPEYRERIVELARAGRSPESLAEDFEPTATTIRNWVREAKRTEKKRREEKLPVDEREELVRLRRENRMLREEKEILKKAAAWFAQEANRTPPKRSGS